MDRDVEKGHGYPQELSSAPPDKLQRPLTTEEKIAATTVDIDSRGSDERSKIIEYNSIPVKQDNGVLSKLRNFEETLDAKLGVESQAIDRKLPDQRTGHGWWDQVNMAFLWASGTMNISCFATGFIGPLYFGLNLKDNLLVIIFGSFLGAMLTGFCATFGAPTGLRQISVSRYSMGWYPNKLIALLNSIQNLGWAAVACITGGLALEAVSNGHLSVEVGIVIIAVVSFIVSFVGLRAILVYEKYAWFVFFIVFMIVFGMTAPYYDNSAPPTVTGATLSGNVLTVLAIIYGSSASWSTCASDYYVQYPVNVSRWKVFILTTCGIAIPTSIGMSAGACVVSGFANVPAWSKAYDNGLGFLIQTILYPRGFADFILVLLVLSGINNSIISVYSSAISFQQMARPFARIPRFLWNILCFAIVIALASAGRNQLLTYLEDFLSLLGYWCTSYVVIVFSEHFIFRKGDFKNYNLEAWNDRDALPMGLAAATAWLLGLAAWIIGMVSLSHILPSLLISMY